jgi:phosphoribosylformylglycinamidine synthase
VRVETTNSPFTKAYRAMQVVRIPIAHNEGNYFADPDTLDRLFDTGRVAFRYCTPTGDIDDGANPNGAQRSIAGILNERGNVLGMMPHPERVADPLLGGTDGAILFESLLVAA